MQTTVTMATNIFKVQCQHKFGEQMTTEQEEKTALILAGRGVFGPSGPTLVQLCVHSFNCGVFWRCCAPGGAL